MSADSKSKFISSIQIVTGIIFLIAAVGRLFFWQESMAEFTQLGLGVNALIVTIGIELYGAICLLSNRQIKIACTLLVALVSVGLVLATIQTPLLQFKTLIHFAPNAQTILLHVLYIFLMGGLFFATQKKKQ